MNHFRVTLTLSLTSDEVKNKLFQKMVMMHIKLKAIIYTTYKQIFRPYTLGEVKRPKKILLKMVMLDIKLKRMTRTPTCKQ